MADVRPYAVPTTPRINFKGWFSDNGVPLEDWVEGWDPQSDIVLLQTIDLDIQGMLADSGLSSNVKLKLTVSCTSTDTGMTEVLQTCLASAHQTMHVTLPGERIGGALKIRTTVSLAARNSDPRPGIVVKAGSILAEHVHVLRLAGDASMFPTSVVDFAGTSIGPFASWHLQTSEELDLPFLGTFLLLINERDKELLKAIAAKKPTVAQQALITTVEFEVAEAMLELALVAAVNNDLASFAPDSIGNVYFRYVQMASSQGVLPASLEEDLTHRRSRLSSLARANGFGRRFV
ncbi:hypothetical protein [Curtobacterium sp. MCLR17_034]|uniref:hypothetical protein n=1 Tax=Curtobacterium sp. MCLR17_034 TaxID=2175623 RepID=UPI0011B381E2|nr:hypothetical protein [Curtobacterium sp. MCLR17_034]